MAWILTKNKTNGSGGESQIDTIKVNDVILIPDSDKAVNIEVPTNTNDLVNNSGFITNTVDNLLNYYLKTETYSKNEVNSLIDAVSSVTFEVVQTLPSQDISVSTIYLVPKQDTETNDIYDEYIYVNNVWEKIGSTEMDLTDYVTTSDLNNALAAYTTSQNLNNLLNAKQDKTDNGIKTTAKTVVGAINELLNKFTNYFTKTEVNEMVNPLKAHTRTNLLNPTAQTQTINGVTFTNNGDGTYTVNGTPSSGDWATLVIETTDIKGGCKLVGCPQGGGTTSFALFKAGSGASEQKIDYGNGVRIESDESNARFSIIIYKGYTANNLLFKPMLTTDLNAKYDDYVPYTGGSGRLNENVAEIYKVSDRISNETHTNLLNPTAQTQTVNGVTFTNNGDGTYTVNGTASGLIWYSLADQFTDLDLSREYKIVGCPQGGSYSSGYALKDDENAIYDIGNGAIYTPTNQPKLYIRIGGNTTCNNLRFKPMLTTDLSATYNDFVQYSGNGELNENVAEMYKVSDRISNETHTNLLNPTAQTQTKNGVTFTNNGDGTYTVNGTATDRIFFEFYFDDANFLKVGETYKYIVKIPNQSGILDQIYYWDNGSYSANFVNGVFEYNSSHQKVLIRIQVAGNATFNNVILKPMITTDLSATYNDFVQYSGDGELNENVAEIYIETNSAEDALQNEGYKYPIINGVKNYTDSNGVYHKNLGVVDLGTLNWRYINQYVCFSTTIPTIKLKTNNIECARYKAYDSMLSASNLPNMGIKLSGADEPVIFIKNTTYTDATAFKNAMSGVLLFYELETPQTWNSKSEISRVSDETYTNLLNPTTQTATINGVTFTNNGDGTYTVNGTTSDNTWYPLADQFTDLDLSREYKMVGCPQGGSKNNGYTLQDNVNEIYDTGNGVIYTPTKQTKFFIRIVAGTTCNNLVFKPMITTKLDATYDDYIPYSGSGALNENVAEIYKVSDRISDETHTNLLNPTAQTQTKNGVTFTNNGDGTYKVNGTASPTSPITLVTFDDYSILENTKLVGSPVGGGTNTTYTMYITCYNGSTWLKDYIDRGDGVLVSNIPPDATSIRLLIIIRNGYTANNLLFKPMLTTDLNATYDDYVPYTGGSGRLNEDVAEMYNISRNNIVKFKEYQVTFNGAEAQINMTNDGILATRVLSVTHIHSSGLGYAIQFIPSTNPYQMIVARQRWNSGTPTGITTSEIVTLRVNYY